MAPDGGGRALHASYVHDAACPAYCAKWWNDNLAAGTITPQDVSDAMHAKLWSPESSQVVTERLNTDQPAGPCYWLGACNAWGCTPDDLPGLDIIRLDLIYPQLDASVSFHALDGSSFAPRRSAAVVCYSMSLPCVTFVPVCVLRAVDTVRAGGTLLICSLASHAAPQMEVARVLLSQLQGLSFGTLVVTSEGRCTLLAFTPSDNRELPSAAELSFPRRLTVSLREVVPRDAAPGSLPEVPLSLPPSLGLDVEYSCGRTSFGTAGLYILRAMSDWYMGSSTDIISRLEDHVNGDGCSRLATELRGKSQSDRDACVTKFCLFGLNEAAANPEGTGFGWRLLELAGGQAVTLAQADLLLREIELFALYILFAACDFAGGACGRDVVVTALIAAALALFPRLIGTGLISTHNQLLCSTGHGVQANAVINGYLGGVYWEVRGVHSPCLCLCLSMTPIRSHPERCRRCHG